MLHLHLLKGYGVLLLLWDYRQREIILSFLKILSFPNFQNIPRILNFPITLITQITQNFPTIPN